MKRFQQNARNFPLPFAAGVQSEGVGEDHSEDHLVGGRIAQYYVAVVFRVIKVAEAFWHVLFQGAALVGHETHETFAMVSIDGDQFELARQRDGVEVLARKVRQLNANIGMRLDIGPSSTSCRVTSGKI